MPGNKQITVISVELGKEPRVVKVALGLESLQREVERYIEYIYPFNDPVAILVDEEGILKCKPFNCAIRDRRGNMLRLYGKFLVVGVGRSDFASLTSELVQKYIDFFKLPQA